MVAILILRWLLECFSKKDRRTGWGTSLLHSSLSSLRRLEPPLDSLLPPAHSAGKHQKKRKFPTLVTMLSPKSVPVTVLMMVALWDKFSSLRLFVPSYSWISFSWSSSITGRTNGQLPACPSASSTLYASPWHLVFQEVFSTQLLDYKIFIWSLPTIKCGQRLVTPVRFTFLCTWVDQCSEPSSLPSGISGSKRKAIKLLMSALTQNMPSSLPKVITKERPTLSWELEISAKKCSKEPEPRVKEGLKRLIDWRTRCKSRCS